MNPSPFYHFRIIIQLLLPHWHIGLCMVRKLCIQMEPIHSSLQFPLHIIITEVETIHILKEKNRFHHEYFNALEELLLYTRNDTVPPSISMLEPLSIRSNLPPPLPLLVLHLELTPLFKELKIKEPSTYSEKASEFYLLLTQCKLYIHTKTLTFYTDETGIAFIISLLCGGL